MTTMLPGSVRSTQWLPLGIAFSAGGVDAGGEFFDTSFSVHAGAITLFDALTSAASPCDGGIGTFSVLTREARTDTYRAYQYLPGTRLLRPRLI